MPPSIAPRPRTPRAPGPLPPSFEPAGRHRQALDSGPQPSAPQARPARKLRRRRWPKIVALVVVLLLAWPVGLALWANGKIKHVDALSGAPKTPGTTYLLVGSDSRADGAIPDGTDGQRADSVLLLHQAPNGQTSLVSLPRDTYAEIPGHRANKLNAAYSFGGPKLLARTVEKLTGLTIDHYVEIGMAGVVQVVDSVGGVRLCLDYNVNDVKSELVWQAGCHQANGRTALAFARMRYADPLGDIGRAARQRQVIGAVMKSAATLSTFVNPLRQVALISAGTAAVTTDGGTGILSLGKLALAFKTATGEKGLTGAPPIATLDYRPGGNVGSAVLLDPKKAPAFFSRLMNGELTAADFAPAK